MIDLSGNPELREEITGYLAVHFPPNQRKAARPVSGRAQIAFKEWQVPSLGQRSRDPVEAADGTIWWAGQWGNLIGKIEPRSEESRVGKEGVSTGRSRWSPYHKKKKERSKKYRKQKEHRKQERTRE